MKKPFSFTVEYDRKPPGEQRVRATKSGIIYTPTQTRKARQKIAVWAKIAGVRMIEEGIPVAVEFVAYFKMPDSFSKKKREQVYYGKLFPTIKPDLDNIEVLVLNALNGVAWHDDRQIVSVSSKKQYSHSGGLFIKISEI